jgi:hypothetical protein
MSLELSRRKRPVNQIASHSVGEEQTEENKKMYNRFRKINVGRTSSEHKIQKLNFPLKISRRMQRSMKVTTLPPSLDWKLKLFLAHFCNTLIFRRI